MPGSRRLPSLHLCCYYDSDTFQMPEKEMQWQGGVTNFSKHPFLALHFRCQAHGWQSSTIFWYQHLELMLYIFIAKLLR
eukprot:scaffold404546_cov45-Prasinocladus_malaysianus.AAC.1